MATASTHYIPDALDEQLFNAFPGLVIRKDLTSEIRGMSKAPSYVIEFMLGIRGSYNYDSTRFDALVTKVNSASDVWVSGRDLAANEKPDIQKARRDMKTISKSVLYLRITSIFLAVPFAGSAAAVEAGYLRGAGSGHPALSREGPRAPLLERR